MTALSTLYRVGRRAFRAETKVEIAPAAGYQTHPAADPALVLLDGVLCDAFTQGGGSRSGVLA